MQISCKAETGGLSTKQVESGVEARRKADSGRGSRSRWSLTVHVPESGWMCSALKYMPVFGGGREQRALCGRTVASERRSGGATFPNRLQSSSSEQHRSFDDGQCQVDLCAVLLLLLGPLGPVSCCAVVELSPLLSPPRPLAALDLTMTGRWGSKRLAMLQNSSLVIGGIA